MDEAHGEGGQDHAEQIGKLNHQLEGEKKENRGTVAASSGSGGSTSNFVAPVISSAFTPSRVELKGWRVWRNIRGTEMTMDEERTLVSEIKNQISDFDLCKFNWALTDRDQGNFRVQDDGVCVVQ